MVARNPNVLNHLEWRDLERLVAELFDGLGFQARLTPSAKDDGKDVVLTCEVSGSLSEY